MPGKLGLHNYTQFPKRHQKALFIIRSILGGIKLTSLKYTVSTNPRNPFSLVSLSACLLHLDLPKEKHNTTGAGPVMFSCTEQIQHVTLNTIILSACILTLLFFF